MSSPLRFTILPLSIVFSTPQLYKVVEISLNNSAGYFSMLAPSLLTFLSLPENTHSHLMTILFGTIVSMPQPISEGAGANSTGYCPPNAAVATLPYSGPILIEEK